METVSTHSRLKAAEPIEADVWDIMIVSTHSRLKAAEQISVDPDKSHQGFNTQPPEGG